MQNRINILLALLICFVYPLKTFAQKPNYTGNWALNQDKSKLESRPEGLTGSLFVIKQDGDEFKLTRYHFFGEKKKKISFKMTADGKTRGVKLLFKGKLEWKDNSLMATLWRKNFRNVVNYNFGDSQNEFIADEVFTGNPKNHHNIWIFDRDNYRK